MPGERVIMDVVMISFAVSMRPPFLLLMLMVTITEQRLICKEKHCAARGQDNSGVLSAR
jgi:hypothetical protein